MPFHASYRVALLLAFVFALPACDGGDPEPTLIGGVDFDRLYQPATTAEVQAVQADWNARTYPVRNAQIAAQATDGGATLYIVSHTQSNADGSDFTHYGLIRVPDGATDLPILVYNHGGDDGFNVTGTVDLLSTFPTLAAQTVQVVPVYRSEVISAEGREALGGPFAAGGAPSPWDRDVDDAIALLNVALALFAAETDENRLGTLGISRGGGVALLMAARDNRLAVVTNYFGVTDFFEDDLRLLAQAAAGGITGVLDLPGVRYLTETLLVPLGRGEFSYEEARLELVRRSVVLYTASLPNLQTHHHMDDGVVPFSQAAALDAAVRALSNQGAYDYNPYEGALPDGITSAHDPRAMPPSFEDTEAFHQTHLLTLVPAPLPF